MTSRAHDGLVWSTRQPILLQFAVHSTCHNLARASKDFQLCAVLKPSNETGCLM